MIVVFFLIALVAGVVHIFLGHFADGGLLLGVAACIGVAMRVIAGQAKERRAFLEWLKSKQPEIEKGWAFYNGQKVTLKTEVTQYQACVSLIIMTSRFRSRYVIAGSDGSSLCLIFTVVSLLFGWWGFPWGFVFTPQAIYRNLRGGYRQTVAELLPKIDAELSGKATTQKLSTILANAKAEARG
jgi:hypothetical protein